MTVVRPWPATTIALLLLFGWVAGGCTNVAISAKPGHFAPDTGPATSQSVQNLSGIAEAIGVDLGAGSGYLIGAAPDKIRLKRANEARAAAERSRVAPATPDDARRSDTADLNGDGFVTVDEVLAMQKTSLSDSQMIDRLERTGQVFILSEQQRDYLADRGVSQKVIDAMTAMHGD